MHGPMKVKLLKWKSNYSSCLYVFCVDLRKISDFCLIQYEQIGCV